MSSSPGWRMCPTSPSHSLRAPWLSVNNFPSTLRGLPAWNTSSHSEGSEIQIYKAEIKSVWAPCSSLLPVAVTDIMTVSVGEKGFIWLRFPHHSPSLASGRNLEVGTGAEAMEEASLPILLSYIIWDHLLGRGGGGTTPSELSSPTAIASITNEENASQVCFQASVIEGFSHLKYCSC